MSDLLDYVKRIENNEETGVGLDDFAPLPGASDYDENKDPEMQDLIESLQEARMSRPQAIEAYLSSTEEPTYKDFMKSQFAHPKMTADQFAKDVAYLRKRGVGVGTGVRLKSTGGTGYADEAGAIHRKDPKKRPGPYDEEKPEVYEGGEYAKKVASLTQQFGTASLDLTSKEIFDEITSTVKSIIGKDPLPKRRHIIIYGDPGIGKTYEVTKACKEHKHSKYKFVEIMGSGLNDTIKAVVPFMFINSQDCVILLDDCDKMLKQEAREEVLLFLKGIMAEDADERPTSYPVHRKDEMEREVEKRRGAIASKQEGCTISIDLPALKENKFILKIDNEIIIDKHISLREAQEWQNKIRPLKREETKYENIYSRSLRDFKRLDEGNTVKDFLNDYGADPNKDKKDSRRDDEDDNDIIESDGSMPESFTFNSSIIFVSNLEMEHINSALLTRVSAKGVKLSMLQFLDRLGAIYGGLAKGGNPEIREWSKKCVFTLIGILIEAWRANVPIFGSPVEINRKLTFRMFNEFVDDWERYADDECRNTFKKDLDPRNKDFLDKLSEHLIPIMLKRKCIPWLKTVERI